MFRSIAVLAFCLGGAPAMAEDVPFSPAVVDACLEKLDRKTDRRVCVGQAAQDCGQAGDRVACMGAEITYWDSRLDGAFRLVLDRSKGKDDDAVHLNLQPRDQAGALQTAQDSWRTYRTDTCAFEQTLWGSGQADAPEVLACHLYLTAEQVFYLEALALIE